MKKIHLIWPIKSLKEQDDLVAVFDDESLAKAFTQRNPEFEGSYEIEERELNPAFEISNLPPFLVILDPYKEEDPNIIRIKYFDDEQGIQNDPISKSDDTFFMYLFAENENEALAIATRKLEELMTNGEWDRMEDEADIRV